MKLYLVRHGESFGNKKGIVQGHYDYALTDLGYIQARKVANRLKDEKFDFIYSSDLKRARDTAEEIARFHLNREVVVSEKLRERDMGSWEGLFYSDVDFNSLDGSTFEKRPPSGESRREHMKRLQDFMGLKEKEFKGKKVLFVSHAGTIRLIIKDLLGMDLSDALMINISNSSLSVIDFSGNKPDLVLSGCVKHLED